MRNPLANIAASPKENLMVRPIAANVVRISVDQNAVAFEAVGGCFGQGKIVLAVPACPFSGGLCCKTLFGSLQTNFPGCGRGDRKTIWGTTSTGAELTGNFGSAP
jgi:hypothetical protein